MESIITFDQELFLFLNGLGSNRFDQFWMLMTHRGSNVLVYVSIILLLSLKIKKKTDNLLSNFWFDSNFGYRPID